MQELLNEIMDEAAELIADLSMIRGQFTDRQKITAAEVARLKRHVARIGSMLQALDVQD